MAARAVPTRALRLSLPVVFCSSACGLIAGLDGERDLAPVTQAGTAGLNEAGGEAGATLGDAGSGLNRGGVAGAGGSLGGSGPHGGGGATVAAGSTSQAGANASAGNGGDDGGGRSGGGKGGAAGVAGSAIGSSGEGGSETGGEAGGASEPVPPPPAASCDELDACGTEKPCTTLYVPGGEGRIGRSEDGPDAYIGGTPSEQPEHVVRVSSFWLDKHEVTVGRFRRFVEAYDDFVLEAEMGAHPRVENSGWKQEFYENMPRDRDALETLMISRDEKCNENFRTWTIARGANECLPVNCVDWFVSYAFCIWDGGRLPSDAEWEFAAAGGSKNYLFPWGEEPPDDERAVYQCTATGDSSCVPSDIRPIGTTRSSGYGRFGHADLAGSMIERTRDVMDPNFYSTGSSSGDDVMNLAFDALLVYGSGRGGSFLSNGSGLRGASREEVYRTSRWDGVGLRCARNPVP